jgi:hypothetical protein
MKYVERREGGFRDLVGNIGVKKRKERDENIPSLDTHRPI